MAERTLEYIPLDELEPDERNPKAHDLDELRASLGRWGYTMPVMIDERTGKLVAGHGRRELLLDDHAHHRAAADGIRVLEDGRWAVPVIRGWASTDDLEAWGYLVADNRLPERGGWTLEKLAPNLAHLAATPGGLEGIGYDREQVDEIVARARQDEAPEPRTPADAVPPLPDEPVTKAGDVWLLGPHRLVCGDSTSAGALVFDGFAGSGSTLIAAEATARTAALVELDERYADVICARWQAHTGIVPRRPDGTEVDFA